MVYVQKKNIHMKLVDGNCKRCKSVVDIKNYHDIESNEKVLKKQFLSNLYLWQYKQIYHHLDFILMVYIQILCVETD